MSMFSLVIMMLLFVGVQSLWVTVPTGHVALWRTFGKLNKELSTEGLSFYNPASTSYEIVDAMSQSDIVYNTKCVSADKQLVIFGEVRIVNRLPEDAVFKVLSVFQKPPSDVNPSGVPYDIETIHRPVTQYIKEMCSQYTGEELRSDMYGKLNEMIKSHLIQVQQNRVELNGENTDIDIIAVTVDIPQLNADVEKNYQSISKQKTARLAEEARQETELKKAETEKKLMEVTAERERSIAATKNLQLVDKERSESEIEKIRATSQADKSRIEADALSYANHKRANDNEILLTPEYIMVQQIESYGCQNIIHYGHLPSFLPDVIQQRVNSENNKVQS